MRKCIWRSLLPSIIEEGLNSMDKDQYIMDLYDESKFDIEGIKNSEIGSRYKYNLKRRPISRSFIIESGIYHIFNPGEGYKNNLEYIDDVLNLYGFHSVYPRSPEEVAYYYCLVNNMTNEEYQDIISSDVFSGLISDIKTEEKEDITVGWIKEQLKKENPNSEKTKHYTQQVSYDIIKISSNQKSGVSGFLKYIDSDEYKANYSLNRATTTYYFRKYVNKIIEKRISAFQLAQKVSREMEYDDRNYDELCEQMNKISEELYFKLNDCPLQGEFEIIKNQGINKEAEWRKIEKSRWNTNVWTEEELGMKERKSFQEKELKFDKAKVNLEDFTRQLMKNMRICDGINEKDSAKVEKALRDKLSSVIRGQKDVTRNLLILIMAFNGESLDDINGILSGCGFYIIRDTNEDVIMKKMMNREKISYDDLIFTGLTRKPHNHNGEKQEEGK